LGAPASAAETVEDLRRAGFTESRENPIGWFESQENALVIHAVSPEILKRCDGMSKMDAGTKDHKMAGPKDHKMD